MKYNRPLTILGASAGILLASCTSESPNHAPNTTENPTTSASPTPTSCDSYGGLSSFEVTADDAGKIVLRVAGIENGGQCVEMYDETTLKTIENFPVNSEVQDVCLQPDKPPRLHGHVRDADGKIEGAIPLSDGGFALAVVIGMTTCELTGSEPDPTPIPLAVRN